jgi:hypothetical protein
MRSVALLAFLASLASGATRAADLCLECLSVRVGPPEVVRGPFPDELDNAFPVLKLPGAGYRGFSANGTTFAIDGETIAAMDGVRRPVLSSGPKGSPAECGRWLNSVFPSGDLLYGFVHQESGCDYDHGQTHKSMAAAVSRDDGLSWQILGDIITGSELPRQNAVTGEGDCTMVDGQDGYLYAYCLRNSDSRTIAARAPLNDLGPGGWRKFRDGDWDVDALGGEASAIGFSGVASAYLKDLDRVALFVADPWFAGIRMSRSSDKANFVDFPEPLFPIDATDWQRPAPSDLIAYLGAIDPKTGSSTVSDSFVLAAVYVAPGDTFAHRYLVYLPVKISKSGQPVLPQVGVALTRWRQTDGTTRTSSGPIVADGFALEARLGYLMTRAPVHAPSVKLEECSTGADFRLGVDGTCAANGVTRLRTAGWAYRDSQPGTVALYVCESVRIRFISNDAACEGSGAPRERLGYALAE